MKTTYLVHILAGVLGLASGYLALYATKGSRLHRRAGMVFVWVMLTVCAAGLVMALGRNVAPSVNVPAALITSYLIVTSLTTVRPLAAGGRWLHVGAMLVALSVGVVMIRYTAESFAGRAPDGMPAFPFIMFGTVGFLGAVGDVRVLRSGPLRGAKRLVRHLWRMCFALFIAALSFFIGQSDEFPAALRIMPLLALPVLVVLATMFYWLWRVRFKRRLSGIVGLGAMDAA